MVYNAVECCNTSAVRNETPKALPSAELLLFPKEK